MWLVLYLLSVAASWWLVRRLLMLDERQAEYWPHAALLVAMFVPIINLPVLGLLFIEESVKALPPVLPPGWWRRFWRVP